MQRRVSHSTQWLPKVKPFGFGSAVDADVLSQNFKVLCAQIQFDSESHSPFATPIPTPSEADAP